MRLLGIETSSRRGSVALVENGAIVAHAAHERANAHAEELGVLLDRVMAEAGWPRASLDRVAVGMGPGSFTGVRVGIAFAEGIALGLGVEFFGLASLRAMARGAPESLAGLRVPLLDARRGEVFGAAYDVMGNEIVAPIAVARDHALAELAALAGDGVLFLGEMAAELGAPGVFRSEATDLPNAGYLALAAAELPVELALTEPLYVRDAGAVLPDLPPSPFRNP